MVSINKISNVDGDNLFDFELKGLSTDEKPTQVGGKDIEVNSLFLELDTGDFYYFDGEDWQKVGG